MSQNTLQQKIFASFSFSKADLVVYTDDGKISGIRDYFAPTGDAYTFSQPIEAVKDGEIVYGRFSSLNDSIYVAPTKDVTGDMLFWVKTEKLPFIMLSYYDGACYYGKGVKDQPIVSSAGPSYQELRINGVAVKDTAQNIADLTLGKFALVEFRGLTIPKTPWKFGGYKAADGTDYSWQGLVGHVVLTFSALNDIEIAELEARMVQEYNALDVLPADHPFKSGVKSYNNTIVGRTPAVKITSWLKPTVAIVDYDNAQPVAKLTNVQPDGSFIYETDSTKELKANVTYELTQETMDVVGGTEDYEFVKQMDGGTVTEKNWSDATIDALNDQISALKESYATTDATIADLNSQVTTLTSDNRTKDVKIATLNESLTAKTNEVNSLNSVIEGELSDLSVQVDDHETRIKTIESGSVAVDLSNYYNKTTADGLLAKKADASELSNYVNKSDFNTEIAKKVATSDLTANYYTNVQVDTKLAEKAAKTDIYTKTEINDKFASKADALTTYTKTEIDTKLDNALNSATLDNYYTKGEMDTSLALKIDKERVYTKSEATALLADKADASALATETSEREAKDTELQTAMLEKVGAITTSLEDMKTSMLAGTQKLEAADTKLQEQVDAINAKIPTTATPTNLLATVDQVTELIQHNTADQLASNLDGAAFADLTALGTGPWYKNGSEIQQSDIKKGDYALVENDGTHTSTCRYNYDGTAWVFYQELKETSFTAEQLTALNSGASAYLINKIEVNESNIAKETSARDAQDNVLLKRIAAEETTRASEDTVLLSKIGTEESARKSADNTLQTSITALQNDKADLSNVYVKAAMDEKLATKIDKSVIDTNYYTKTQVDAELAKKIPTDFYTKTQTDAKLQGKVDTATLTANYTNNTDLADQLALKADKSALADYALKTDLASEVTTQMANLDVYSKSEVNAKLLNKVDTTTLTANYTDNAGLKKQLDAKVDSTALQDAVKQRQDEQAQLVTSFNTTSKELSAQITSLSSELTTASENFSTKLTAVNQASSDGDATINTRIDTLIENVNAVKTDLLAADTVIKADIATINEKIPSAASADNQLADKAYVQEQVANNAARAISSSAGGDSFASLAALQSGPWFYQGAEIDTIHSGDYAIVTADALNDGNDVRYNYDGAGWVKFQVFQNGAGFTPTTEQTAALNSGITRTLTAQITTNTNSITQEVTDRKAAVVDLQAADSTEQSARQTADRTLQSNIDAEATARNEADNTIKASITKEETARKDAINTLAVTVSTNKTNIEKTVGTLASLNTDVKTSIVDCINDLHNELHDERVAKAGDTMSGTLNINLTGSGDLLTMNASDKGVAFKLDADTGFMSIVPVSAPTTGFEVSANALLPRTSAISYSLGSNTNYWTNAYITNINGKAVSDFMTQGDLTTLNNLITNNTTEINKKITKTGDTMTGTLKVILPSGGDIFHIEGGGKGLTFTMDATTGYLHLVPVSAPSTGFEFSATGFMPRTNGVTYTLGTSSNPWTQAWITNLNGLTVDSLITEEELAQQCYSKTEADEKHNTLSTRIDDRYTKTETDNKLSTLQTSIDSKANTADVYAKTESYSKDEVTALWNTLNARVATLENNPVATETKYFILQSQQLVLSSQSDKVISIRTNLSNDEITITYDSGNSTFAITSDTTASIHYVSGTSQNTRFEIFYKATGESMGYGYLCTSSNGGNTSTFEWISGVGNLLA